jgi:hypothetical protein
MSNVLNYIHMDYNSIQFSFIAITWCTLQCPTKKMKLPVYLTPHHEDL